MNWQPIETAPKNEWVLIYMPWSNTVRQGQFNTRGPRQTGWRACFGASAQTLGGTLLYRDPTHWMPLPEPPAAALPLKPVEKA